MRFEIESASGQSPLRNALSRVDISVPERTQGRKKHHVEIWTICRLLSTLSNAQKLSYPISIVHRDRPDFLIKVGNVEIGVEVTEAISQQYAKYCALAEIEFPGALIEPAHFGWDAPRRTKNEMRQLLRQNQLTSDGWVGDRPEKDWARFIQKTVETKLEKLAHSDFPKFGQNWLAVYGNLPLPPVRLKKAVPYLRSLISTCWSRTPSFDTVFIEEGSSIVCITQRRATRIPVNDIWK